MRSRSLLTTVAVLMTVMVGLSWAIGCSGWSTGRSAETSATPPPAVAPSPPDLTTPIDAVESYGEWISYAYRVLDSDVATHAFSVYEEVRVNSYVQLLGSERRRAIEQRLLEHDYQVVSQEASKAVVAGTEEWTYRYIDIDTRTYATPPAKASYDVTYTLVVEPAKGWVVDRVDAVSDVVVE